MNISVMYKIYHRSCDFSTGSAWGSSNRLVRAQLYAKTDGWIAEEGRVLRRKSKARDYPQGATAGYIFHKNQDNMCTRLLRRRSKARDYPQGATAGYIFHKNQDNNFLYHHESGVEKPLTLSVKALPSGGKAGQPHPGRHQVVFAIQYFENRTWHKNPAN